MNLYIHRMKALNLFFIILFVLSAAVQYNDPDPYVWIPIYLYAAWLCYLAIKNRYNGLLYLAGFVVFIVYAAILFVQPNGVYDWLTGHRSESIVQTMKAEKPWIESAREFFGLLIVLCSMIANIFWLRKRSTGTMSAR